MYARDVTTHQLWPRLRKMGNIMAFKPRNMCNVRVNADHLRVIAEKTEGIPLFVETFTPTEFAEFRQAVIDTGSTPFSYCTPERAKRRLG